MSWKMGLNNGRFIFESEFVDDLQKIAQTLADPKSEVVMVLDAPDDDLTLCNSTTAERFVEASPDDLLDWIYGFREL